MLAHLKRIVAMAATALVVAGPAKAETLTDALVSAYNNSGLLEQNRALLRAADEDVADAIAALRPVLNYVGSSSWSDPVAPGSNNLSGSVALQAEMLLFDFGSSQLRVDAAKESVLSTRAALIGVEQSVLLRAVSAYVNVRRQIASVNLQQNNVRVIGEQLRAARDRFEVGEITSTDVAITEARLASARSGLAAAQGALERARAEYQAAVGRAPGALQTPPAAPATASSERAAQAVAQDRHPDILAAQRDVTVAELNVALAEAAVRPRLTASGQVSRDDQGDTFKSLGVNLSGPIYQGGAIASSVRRAEALRESSRAGLLQTAQSVSQNVSNAWADLRVAQATLAATDEEVRSARLALRGARQELEVGSRTTLDVLDREQELLQAETSRVDAESDRYIAVYELLSRMGLLTVDHLGLDVPQYDPAAYYNAVSGAPLGTSASSEQGARLDELLRAIGRE